MESKKSPLKITGKLIWVSEEITGTNANGEAWNKKSFLLEVTESQYTNHVGFVAWGKMAIGLDAIKERAELTVYFTPITRVHENKFYTDLKAYGINVNFGKV
jgi:hypothetical protein